MAKDFTPLISVEKMAAYLDSNLPEEEMQSVHSVIEEDANMGNLLDQASIIDNDWDEFSLGQNPLDLDLPDSWLLPDPHDTSIEIDFSLMDDLFTHDSGLVDIENGDTSLDNNLEEY